MWDEVGDRQLFGPDLIKESEEKVKLIRDRLKVAMKSKIEHISVRRHFEELNVWSQRKVGATICGTIQSFGTYG